MSSRSPRRVLFFVAAAELLATSLVSQFRLKSRLGCQFAFCVVPLLTAATDENILPPTGGILSKFYLGLLWAHQQI